MFNVTIVYCVFLLFIAKLFTALTIFGCLLFF